jgi:hypothetical protein
MSEQNPSPRDVFRDRLREVGVHNTEIMGGDPKKVYVFADEGGYGITADCYDGLNARLIESIGMDSLTENHRLYRPYAHHVLIFKVSSIDSTE